MPALSKVTTATIDEQPEVYEAKYVHEIYDQIASHFSSTRYMPWPVVAKFISDLPTGWVGLDSGTGNGKYLPLPIDRPGSVWTIGLDRSRNLLGEARKAGDAGILREVVWGDALGRGWRKGAFDYAISIATIHHLATPERRRLAVKRLIESVSPAHGRVLIYVWAIEQDDLSKRTIPVAEGANLTNNSPSTGYDVFVPWVLADEKSAKKPRKRAKKRRGPNEPSQSEEVVTEPETQPVEPKIFNRYYHMFAEGELRGLVCDAAMEMNLKIGQRPEQMGRDVCGQGRGIEIVQDGWERSNYYVEFRRWQTCNDSEH
ncbi:hypothetical protein DENSPDRAFT_857964 [Dentipellis sp. KUC8613]|nr:hypothetical protein DENSPDRAFT_857964 [Dentipellis sp. KUC8613]